MRVSGIVKDSIVDGPGFRYTVFTQGCLHNCPGCHNPETHDFCGGSEMATDTLIHQMLSNPLTSGLTLSGGDPMEQALECAKLAEAAHKAGLDVLTYTGYTFEEILSGGNLAMLTLLNNSDILVDGRFLLERRTLTLPFRGSDNQRLVDVRASLAQGKAIFHNIQ